MAQQTALVCLGGAALLGSFFYGRATGAAANSPAKAAEKPFIYIPSKPHGPDAVKAWGVYKPKGKVEDFTYEPRPLGDSDVEIKITHCGICASDLHQLDNGWNSPSIFPIVPGHEIIGVVIKKGSKVGDINVGDRVGVGAQCSSCQKSSCQFCSTKLEQYCDGNVNTYNSKYPDGCVAYGGYATRVRVNSHFAFKIPENLKSAEAAPLFCAGATVFEPLKRWNVGKGSKVGVIGIGGLGHLAVQFAAALGAETYAISSTAAKKDLAKQLGATGFISSPEERKAAKKTFDLIIQTDNSTIDLTEYLEFLKPMGQLVLVGIAEGKIQTNPEAIVGGGRNLCGSAIASPSRIQEMLKLASEKNIKAYVQEFPIAQVNEAIEGVRQGKPRFRFVLKIQDA